MAIEEEPEPGIPEWVVTFGDMMSLLLTFFIMLVSMSEIKEEEQFQAVADSMREQFGYDKTMASLIPGNTRPRVTAKPEVVSSQGRAKRKDTANGGQKVKSAVGENHRVQIVRPGDDASIGGTVFFADDSAELTEQNKRDLYRIYGEIAGKPQKIEIRGHTSRRPVDPARGYNDHADLGFARSRSVRRFLLQENIDPKRIRLSTAGASEPLYDGVDPDRLSQNARVQILMWDERVQDLDGDNGDESAPEGSL